MKSSIINLCSRLLLEKNVLLLLLIGISVFIQFFVNVGVLDVVGVRIRDRVVGRGVCRVALLVQILSCHLRRLGVLVFGLAYLNKLYPSKNHNTVFFFKLNLL